MYRLHIYNRERCQRVVLSFKDSSTMADLDRALNEANDRHSTTAFVHGAASVSKFTSRPVRCYLLWRN